MTEWLLLPHLAALRISGPDAVAFAQSQLCSDIDGLTPDLWAPTAWCSPKGNVITVMLACRHENGVDLILPGSQQQAVAARLPMFAIGRNVSITASAGVVGSRNESAQHGRMAQDQQRSLSIEAESTLPESAERVSYWRRDDLCLPLPWIGPSSSERFLPQSLGLETIGGLSHRKGCYPGQEIIARVHYLGKPKYQLLGFRFESAEPPPAEGDTLTTDAGEPAGRVIDALQQRDGCIGLVVSPTRIEAGCRVRIDGRPDGPPGLMTATNGLC